MVILTENDGHLVNDHNMTPNMVVSFQYGSTPILEGYFPYWKAASNMVVNHIGPNMGVYYHIGMSDSPILGPIWEYYHIGR